MEVNKLLKVSIGEELKFDHPEQYAELKAMAVPEWINKFYYFMEKLTDKPVEWLLKISNKIKR